MKNFFEFFGFLSTACVSAILVFLFVGKKENLKSPVGDVMVSEYNASADMPNAPRKVATKPGRSYSTESGNSGKREKVQRESAAPEMAPEERLKSIYNDEGFVGSTAKKWKSIVRDAADEYNIKPQVLLAHVLVESYLGGYSRGQFNQDVAEHAGERVKPVSAAVKNYRYGWTMQKLIAQYDLARYFPEDVPTAAASSSRFVPEKKMTAKGVAAKPAAPVAKNNPAEEGFKKMVAKEYGFSTWSGLQKLADPDTKTEAQKRVKTLMMASRVR